MLCMLLKCCVSNATRFEKLNPFVILYSEI